MRQNVDVRYIYRPKSADMGLTCKVVLLSIILSTFNQVTNCQLQVLSTTANKLLEFIRSKLSIQNILKTSIGYIFEHYLGFPKNISDDCAKDVKSIFTELMNTRIWSNMTSNWPAQIFDSLAKLPSGIMTGNLFWLGSYQQCIDVVAPSGLSSKKFIGEYCLVDMFPKTVPEEFLKFKFPNELSLKIGMCFPSTCSFHDKSLLLNYTTQLMKTYVRAEIKEEYCQTKQQQPMDTTAVVLILMLLLFGILVLSATLVELASYMKNESFTEKFDRSGLGMKLFASFSAIKSLSAIFKTNEKSSDIRCIQGIRAISIGWIITGHTIMYCVELYPWRNQVETLRVFDQFILQPFLFNATYSVTSFFVISGFLVTYLFIRRCYVRHQSPNIIGYFIFRYLRLTPPLIIMIMFISGPFYYINKGPIWVYMYESKVKSCRSQWWMSILYMQNYIQNKDACLIAGWYISADTQLYILAPIILYSLYRKPILGVTLMGIFFASTTIACISQIAVTGQKTFFGKHSTYIDAINYIDNVYQQAYYNAPAYIIGMAAGYIVLLIHRHHVIFSKKIIIPGWVCAVTIVLVIVYGTFPYYNGSSEMSPWVNVMYGSFARSAWALAVSWIIVACALGYGGMINGFLTMPPFVILGRLTYCAYLVHAPIIDYYYFGQKDGLYFSTYNMTMTVFATIVMTTIGAVILAVLIEMPVVDALKQLGKKYDKMDRGSEQKQLTFAATNLEKISEFHALLSEEDNQDEQE